MYEYTSKEDITSIIYILGVFAETLYSEPLECYVVYIPITTSGHKMSVTSKLEMFFREKLMSPPQTNPTVDSPLVHLHLLVQLSKILDRLI